MAKQFALNNVITSIFLIVEISKNAAKVQNFPHIRSNPSVKSTRFNVEGHETPSTTGWAENMHDSKLMSRYVEELTKKDREKWQQSQICMAMMKGGETVCEYIEAKAEEHLIRLTSRMEWFPMFYHLADKVAMVIFAVLGYYTGKFSPIRRYDESYTSASFIFEFSG